MFLDRKNLEKFLFSKKSYFYCGRRNTDFLTKYLAGRRMQKVRNGWYRWPRIEPQGACNSAVMSVHWSTLNERSRPQCSHKHRMNLPGYKDHTRSWRNECVLSRACLPSLSRQGASTHRTHTHSLAQMHAHRTCVQILWKSVGLNRRACKAQLH